MSKKKPRDPNKRPKVFHGMWKTPTHAIWTAMMQRCVWDDGGKYDYKLRGIKVCERWHDFRNFFADMGERPEGKSIDRINNDGDYEPSNCRWATTKEQANNRRSNRIISYMGESKTLSQWADLIGVHCVVLRYRIESGWDLNRAMTTKTMTREEVILVGLTALARSRKRHTSSDGRSHTLNEWSKITKISRRTLKRRMANGWPVDRAISEPPRRGKNSLNLEFYENKKEEI